MVSHHLFREPLITNIMWRNLIIMVCYICRFILCFLVQIFQLNTWFFVQALFQVSVLLTLNFKGISLLQLRSDDKAHADKVKNTFIFNTFVLCQVLPFGFHLEKKFLPFCLMCDSRVLYNKCSSGLRCAFLSSQVFNEFNSRKPDELNIFKGISGNHLFIGIIGITVILQVESLEGISFLD